MYLASASNTFKCHEFSSGEIIHNYQPGTKVEGPIRSISWSRDGNWLALVPWSGMTEILSVRGNLKLLKTVPDVEEPSCACFPNGTKKNICLGTKNGLVLVYDIKTRNVTKRFERHNSRITLMEYTVKDTNIVAGSENGEVFVFSNVTNSPPSVLKVPRSKSITCLKTSSVKRNLVLGGSNEGVVVLWDINIGRPKFVVDAHVAAVNAVAFSPTHADLIVSAGSDRQFSFFDVTDNKCITTITVGNNMTAVDFSADGLSFVMASQNGHVHVYDTRKIQTPVRSFEAHNKCIRHVAFQKSSDSGVRESISNLPSECFTPVSSKPEVQKKRNSDIFGMLATTANSPPDNRQSVASPAGDSFLAALGLSSSIGSMCGDEEVFHRDSTRLPTIFSNSAEENNHSANEQKAISDKCLSIETKPYSSTPILSNPPSQSLFQASANVQNNNVETQRSMPNDLETRLNTLTSNMAEMRKSMEYHILNSAFQLKTMITGVQMAIVRESIETEDRFNQLRDTLNDSVNLTEVRHLIDENEMLRMRIQFLEEQLKNLVSRRDDDNSL